MLLIGTDASQCNCLKDSLSRYRRKPVSHSVLPATLRVITPHPLDSTRVRGGPDMMLGGGCGFRS